MDESIQTKLLPAVEPMKLSDAIRIGAAKRPQCQGWYFDGVGTCALGAAYEGLTGHPPARMNLDSDVTRVLMRWGYIGSEVVIRNDLGHTREQIADWLESKGY